MKQLYLLLISVVFSLVLVSDVKGQCVGVDPASRIVYVDLSAKSDTTWTTSAYTRDGDACGGSTCITFVVTIHPQSGQVGFNVTICLSP
jgi:hypothetical protein